MLAKTLAVARQQIFGLLALFVALGGTSYAVATGSIDSREIKNSTIRSKDIRNNQVRSGDVRNGSLLNRDFKRGQLPAGTTGPVGPRGPRGFTGSPPPVEAPTQVTTFLNGWAAFTGNPGVGDDTPVRYWKDLSGTVHLEGALTRAGGTDSGVLRLPVGYRPAARYVNFPVVTTGATDTNEQLGYIQILGDCCAQNGTVNFLGGNPEFVSLDGISFRAAD